jgi:hypothetical protein
MPNQSPDTRSGAVMHPTRTRHVWLTTQRPIWISAVQGPNGVVDVKGLEPMASRV